MWELRQVTRDVCPPEGRDGHSEGLGWHCSAGHIALGFAKGHLVAHLKWVNGIVCSSISVGTF